MKRLSIFLVFFLVFTILVNAQWTSLSSGLTADNSHNLSSVYFTDASTGYAVGKGGAILKTTNGGTNWTALTSGITDELDAVYFSDANTGYAVGTVILKTTDGGTNWTNVYTSPYQYAIRSIYFVNATTGYAVGMGMMGGTILKTIDGGINWTKQTSGTNNQLSSVYFTDASTGYTVGTNGTILKTTNGGTTWNTQSSGTNSQLKSVYFTDANTGCAVGAASTILRTTNGGTTWTLKTGNTDYTLYSVCFPDANTGYISGSNGSGVGEILKTINGGTDWTTNWTPTNQSDSYYLSLCFPDVNTGYAVGIYGKMLKYSNSTATVVASEDWDVIMNNNSTNYGQETFEKKSDGTITSKGTWHVNGVDCPFQDGIVSITDSLMSFTANGTATLSSMTSHYTLAVTGSANNGKSHASWSIHFSAMGWPEVVEGIGDAILKSGSGVTAKITGIKDIASEKKIYLYPNPVTNYFTVSGIEGMATIEITDLNGKLLISKDVTTNEAISVSTLSNGVYLATIKSNNIRITEKLIIQR